MGETKKVGVTGKYGSRYGVGIRKRVIKVEKTQRARHTCTKCHATKVKRIGSGLFACRKCGHRFAGGMWAPDTMTGRNVAKMVLQRTPGYEGPIEEFPMEKESEESEKSGEPKKEKAQEERA